MIMSARIFFRLFSTHSKCSEVPHKFISVSKTQSKQVTIRPEEISLLERLSLVRFDTADAVRVLQDAICFSEQVLHVTAENVEPMYTVLENENLSLREDKVTEGDCQKDILRNATVTEEDYFVAPQGNIPLEDI